MLPILIENLTNEIQKLPGVGKRGAQKMALDILQHSEVNFENLNQAIHKMRQKVFFCDNCGFFADNAKFDNSQNNFATPFSSQSLPNPNLIPKSKIPKIETENSQTESGENGKIDNLETKSGKIKNLENDNLEANSVENLKKNQQIILEKKLETRVNLENIVKNDMENLETSESEEIINSSQNSFQIDQSGKNQTTSSFSKSTSNLNSKISSENLTKIETGKISNFISNSKNQSNLSENLDLENFENSENKTSNSKENHTILSPNLKQISKQIQNLNFNSLINSKNKLLGEIPNNSKFINPESQKNQTSFNSSKNEIQNTEVQNSNSKKENLENLSTENSTNSKEKIKNKTEIQKNQNHEKLHISHSYNNYLQNFLAIPKNKLCQICQNSHRNPFQICLVEKPTDILNIEKSQIYQGFYHVLSKLISPLDRVFVENTRLPDLFERRIPELLEILEKLNQTILPLKTSQKMENSEPKNEEKSEKIPNSRNFQPNSQSLKLNSSQNLKFTNSNSQSLNSNQNSENLHQIELILFFKTGFSSEATTAYLREKIHQEGWENEIKITKLAEGLPLYYNPDNLDQATMIKALEDRKNLW